MNSKLKGISVCIICKNEELFIEECIKSVIPFSSEIIVLDTGSEDKTKEIAKDLGANVYKTNWENDFSKARNECISYAKYDWILSIDANDIISKYTQENILNFLEKNNFNNSTVLSFKTLNIQPDNFISNYTFRTVMFKNSSDIKYRRKIHEQIYSNKSNLIYINCPEFEIYNYGNKISQDKLSQKFNKYILQLENLLVDSNNEDKISYLYYLGNAYYSIKEKDKSFKTYIQSYELSEHLNFKNNIYYNLIIKIIHHLLFININYDKAFSFINKIIDKFPNLPDLLYYLGIYYQGKENYSKSNYYFEQIINNQESINELNSYFYNLNENVIFEIGRNNIILGNKIKGIQYYEDLLKRKQNLLQVYFHLIYYYLINDDLKKVSNYLFDKNSPLKIDNQNLILKISKLNKNDIRYKTLQLHLLEALVNTNGWLKSEYLTIKNKIEQINNIINTNKISVCIITKNEEKNIERCINSVLPISSEIIVLDTGSEDKTKEIAKDLGANVYKTNWENDFSKARNECISYAKYDWILSIDADEVLSNNIQINLLDFLNKSNFDKNLPIILNFKFKSVFEDNSNVIRYKNCLFRNNKGIYFVGKIHESLKTKNNSHIYINCDDFIIKHLKSNTNTEKNNYYIHSLINTISENENKEENYYYYYHLGNSYSSIGKDDKALENYNQAITLLKIHNPYNISFYSEIILKIIITMIYGKKLYKESLIQIEELLKICPYFPDAIYYKAYCLQYLNKLEKATELYIYLIKLIDNNSFEKLNPNNLVSLEKTLCPMTFNELSRCMFIMGKDKQGLYYLMRGEKLNPNFPPILISLLKYYFLQEDINKALIYYLKFDVSLNKLSFNEAFFKLINFIDNIDGLLPQEKISINNIKNRIIKDHI